MFCGCQPVIIGQPLRRRLGRLGRAIQFGAVAGRQDRRLAHLPPARQFDQRLRQAQRIERHLLAHGKRRGMVVEAEGSDTFYEFAMPLMAQLGMPVHCSATSWKRMPRAFW
jgi:hypothetical protein